MKYVWLAILLVGLGLSWSMGGKEHNERLAMMSDRQFELADLITQSIREKRPEVSGVNFSQLYTEVIHADREMVAHYRYEISAKQNDENSIEVVEGKSTLRSDNGRDWKVVSSNIRQPTVGFEKGETIQKSDLQGSAKAAAPAEPTPAHQAPAGESPDTHGTETH